MPERDFDSRLCPLMFFSSFAVVGCVFAVFCAFIGFIAWSIVQHASNSMKMRDALCARRGWKHEPNPARDVAWRISDGMNGWTLTQGKTKDIDFPAQCEWSAPFEGRSPGEIRVEHRTVIERTQSPHFKTTVETIARVGTRLGAGAAVQSLQHRHESRQIHWFSQPDSSDWGMETWNFSPAEVRALLPDEAQRRFIAWHDTLPAPRQGKASVRIEVNSSRMLRIWTTDVIDNATSLEAFLNFCRAVGRA